ncbi:5746_t:CDS:2 [Paraglomus brasilianum]|uniref:5746_t:CDS:1 n=1 Tax=Paraglomus brasilianum TaxID=144538 RepID=A0A9N9C5N9_9GLOM|nr:5746_t:CDS:2 [Paraglomus brasilianum]
MLKMVRTNSNIPYLIRLAKKRKIKCWVRLEGKRETVEQNIHDLKKTAIQNFSALKGLDPPEDLKVFAHEYFTKPLKPDTFLSSPGTTAASSLVILHYF